MPSLPTIDVTQAQADRMLAAFGSAALYRQWLRRQIVAVVVEAEARNRAESFRATQEGARRQARIDLGDPDLESPPI